MNQTQQPSLILASSSRYRKDLLKRLHLTFDCISPDIDESAQAEETPEALACRLANEKAQAVADQVGSSTNAVIIGSDQVAACEGRILGKPGDFDNAFDQLSFCQGKTVTFYTGISLIHAQTGRALTQVCPFSVNFRELSETQLKNYLLKEEPYDCAGSFKSEGLGIALFTKMEGKDPNALIGLPLIDLIDMLGEFGVEVL